ncbi:hybrid sensor histidine kinase/response regulator [Opitutaceae bacterium TAV4]|nr:hybrid sensor histidine kinase/response regulator [Opitutaceae bacterium TAV4]RRJ98688.1 hybrid sensor histidine kinase/response regulator [Opitutaceae bacterium TAV3]
MSAATTGRILVVDDEPLNVAILKRALQRAGLTVAAAHNGPDALALVASHRPDLILLDVMMPHMDGLEICRRLQANDDTRSIPVIFITGHTSKQDKLHGLGVGAVDYITKPIDLEETLARVQTQLRFVAINREVVDLQRRLQESRRAATLGAITQGIGHNLNNLLGVALGYLELTKLRIDRPAEVTKNLAQIETALKRIVAIVRQLAHLAVETRLPTLASPLDQTLANAITRYRIESGRDEATSPITLQNPLGDLTLHTHVEALEDAIVKLLHNAWESYGGDTFTGPRPVTINTAIPGHPGKPPALEIRIQDRGRGLDPEVRDTLFEPFISTKNTVGVGMGLTVARHTLRTMGGDLTIDDNPGGPGATARILHPLATNN